MWSQLGRDDRAAWGLYAGSAAEPYRVQADVAVRVTHCTCPSRRYPCKHGDALLATLEADPERFPIQEPPQWAADWLAGREAKTSRRAPGIVDEAARAKRVEQREGRVTQGLDELELWLRDLVQQGLVQAPSKPYTFWENAAARLVDSQAPGAARMVRELGTIAVGGVGWQERMVRALGRLTLLIQAWRRLEHLPEAALADVRSAVGFTVSQESVLATEPLRDAWLVAGQREVMGDRLAQRRTWLLGQVTKRPAMLLEFAVQEGSLPPALVVGSVMDAEVCFYPGAAPLRALVKANYGSMERPHELPCTTTVAECHQSLAARYAANPWTERQPACLRGVVPVGGGQQWCLRDDSGALPSFEHSHLLGLSGGHPVDVFAEWDGVKLAPLLVGKGHRFVRLPNPQY
ncbi:MAG: hypothetical protein JNK87_03465 [Bryobacterales bacterium]|nr:hypothetical protein [Bryobacterales bacterium]